jgi:hypothetical protein
MPVNAATKNAAAEALAAIEQYDREGFECGVDRVHLHYSDVKGSWLDELAESELAVPPVGKIQERILFPDPPSPLQKGEPEGRSQKRRFLS